METPVKHGKGYKQVTHDQNTDTIDMEMHDVKGMDREADGLETL
jgi:hypothetical protein